MPHVPCLRRLAAWSLLPVAWAFVQEEGPRYVLCTSAARPPEAWLNRRLLRVYAASVAGSPDRGQRGRQPIPLELRAALFLDEERWEAKLPDVKDKQPDSGHAPNVSYAKCRGHNLPPATKVACRLGGPGPQGRRRAVNGTAAAARLASYRNAELRHDFVSCPLGALALHWRAPGYRLPARIHMEIDLRMPKFVRSFMNETAHVARGVDGASAAVPLELCRVDRPLARLSFCSQPLFGYHKMRARMRWVVEDWLDYHLGHFGFEHAEIYDVDGSFAEALEPFVHNNAWHGRTLTYHKNWPSALSATLQALSQDHPYCTETYAYAHCLTTLRATSRWVALIHAPDEYMVVRKNPADWAFREVVEGEERGMERGETTPFLGVNAFSFAFGGPDAEVEDLSLRGSVLSSSRLRSPQHYHHTPILDPLTCGCAGPHLCYAEAGHLAYYSGMSKEVNPGLLMVHHYVEMMPQLRGRCTTHQGPCQVPDSVMAWAVDMLRAS